MRITVKVHAKRSDVTSAAAHNLGRMFRWRWIVSAIVLAFAAYRFRYPHPFWHHHPIWDNVFVWTFMAIFLLLYPNIVAQLTFRHPFVEEISGPVEYDLTESGMHAVNNKRDSTAGWDRFIGWVEYSKAFLLYRYEMNYSIIPKRGFQNKEDIAEFRNFLQQRFGKERQ